MNNILFLNNIVYIINHEINKRTDPRNKRPAVSKKYYKKGRSVARCPEPCFLNPYIATKSF